MITMKIILRQIVSRWYPFEATVWKGCPFPLIPSSGASKVIHVIIQTSSKIPLDQRKLSNDTDVITALQSCNLWQNIKGMHNSNYARNVFITFLD